jgi:hypothetical protein
MGENNSANNKDFFIFTFIILAGPTLKTAKYVTSQTCVKELLVPRNMCKAWTEPIIVSSPSLPHTRLRGF